MCKNWRIRENELWLKWKYEKLCVFDNDEMNECEKTAEMIKELINRIEGFNKEELQCILDYISTM